MYAKFQENPTKKNYFLFYPFFPPKGLNYGKPLLSESLLHKTKLLTEFHTYRFSGSGSAMMNQSDMSFINFRLYKPQNRII